MGSSNDFQNHDLAIPPVDCDLNLIVEQTRKLVQDFYAKHSNWIKESHGWKHVQAVYDRTCQAVECHQPRLSATQIMEIKISSLLHDVDDTKYFPDAPPHVYPNAREILHSLDSLSSSNIETIIRMISLVSCSENGNSVPPDVEDHQAYHLLIPRWSDRLEAVGPIGVVRCYQYNTEHKRPLCHPETTPRPQTEEQVWEYCAPERFQAYQQQQRQCQCQRQQQDEDKDSDMMSHYYDKLLHVARPPPEIVQNEYLIQAAQESSKELVEMCLRYGRTGKVDENYVHELAEQLGMSLETKHSS